MILVNLLALSVVLLRTVDGITKPVEAVGKTDGSLGSIIDAPPIVMLRDTSTTTTQTLWNDSSIQSQRRRLVDGNTCFFCVTSACAERGDRYQTIQTWGIIWWISTLLGFEDGVWGSCESVCDCGEFGYCSYVDYERHACECEDGYVFNGDTCVMERGYVFEQCGGFAGFTCSPGSLCIDDPTDNCDPENNGSDCIGICLPLCDTSTPCPSGDLQCEAFPGGCDAARMEDCVGVCVQRESPPFPFCQGDDGVACKAGYACMEELRDDCAADLSRSCIGVCQKSCGGPEDNKCIGESEVCVDIKDDGCEPVPFAESSACPGVCVEVPPSCGGTAQISCPMGHVCLNVPERCEVDTEDCPGQCFPECNAIIDERLPCAYGTQCVDVPYDYCPSGTGCPKVCSTGCLTGIKCPLGYQCLPTPCPAPDPAVMPPNECFPVCVEPTQCGGLIGQTCPNGQRCSTIIPGDTCRQNGFTDCGGLCLPECGGPDDALCDNDTFCNDEPFDTCDPVNGGTNCIGTCLRVKDPPIFCGGTSMVSCPLNFECFDSNSNVCNVDSGTCQGYCKRTCGGSLMCVDGKTCQDYPRDACFSLDGRAGCLMVCE